MSLMSMKVKRHADTLLAQVVTQHMRNIQQGLKPDPVVLSLPMELGDRELGLRIYLYLASDLHLTVSIMVPYSLGQETAFRETKVLELRHAMDYSSD